jgi:hypothetical protein
MNTKAVKSFGLALIVAVGVLALLLATGTFSPQKAGAQSVTTDSVSVQPSTVAAGTATPLTVGFVVDMAVTIGGEIKIELPGFTVPETIDPANVSIRGGGSAGNPETVEVSEQTITLTVGDDSAGNPMFVEPLVADGASGQIYVTFTKPAGLAAGDTAGQYAVKVGETAVADDDRFNITPSVTVSLEAGLTGAKLVVKGSSFPKGEVNVRVGQTLTGDEDCEAIGAGGFVSEVKGGTFSESITVSTSDIQVDNTAVDNTGFGYGINCIQVVHDGTGESPATTLATPLQPLASKFVLNAQIDAPDTLVLGSEAVVVKVSKASTNTGIITGVTLGGDTIPFSGPLDSTGDRPTLNDPVDIPASGAVNILIDVPDDAPRGAEQKLELAGTISGATATHGSTTVEVKAIELTLNPSEAVQGVEITVSGSGFTSGGDGAVTSLIITDAADEARTVMSAEDKEASNGRFNFRFSLPDLAAGEATVVLEQKDGSIGEGKLTVKTPTISIDPTESRKGTTVTVTGTGFPANDLIDITYAGNRVSFATSDRAGDWVATVIVPDDADSTEPNEIGAFRPRIGEEDDDGRTDKDERTAEAVEHTVPGDTSTVSATSGNSGDTLTVTGQAHAPYTAVNITIGGASVASEVADINGDFSIPVTIPLFRPGSFQLLVVRVGSGDTASDTLTESIEILGDPTPPASNDPADVFADLIEDGVLESVWIFDNDEDKYRGFNPNASDAERMLAETLGLLLTEVNPGDGGWMNLNADAEFQGTSYKAGWRLVFIR